MLEALTQKGGQGDKPASQTATLVRAPAVLVLLPEGQEDQIIPSFEAGADDYLLKPIDAKDLRIKADLLLGSRATCARAATRRPRTSRSPTTAS